MENEQPKFEGEEWRPVVGFENQYEVSELGHVRRSGRAARTGNGRGGGARIGLVLKHHQSTKEHGYPVVQLWRDGKPSNRLVHLLVAAAFLGPTPVGMEVNHIDTNKTNPALTNLEFLTHLDNMRHAYANSLYPTGEKHSRAKLTADQVRQIRSLHVPGRGGYGCRQTRQTILDGTNWKHLEAGA